MIKHLLMPMLLSFSLLGLFQNCSSRQNFQESQTETESSTEDNEVRSSQNDCRFIGRSALASVLVNVLGLPSGDVAMVNENGEQLKSNTCKSFNHQANGSDCFYLAEYASELNTQLCNASTFRLVSQIYVNACTESLALSTNSDRLFPNGSQDPSAIHLALIGRTPHSDEAQILKDLTTNFESEQEKMTAVCAAIGSSLASINSF